MAILFSLCAITCQYTHFVLQATNKGNPLYITKTATRGQNLYFSATEQKLVFGINIQQCVKNANIANYIKYKISSNQPEIIEIAATDKILVSLCSDNVLRSWDIENTNSMKGVAIENVGRPICFNFSKNDSYLLLGTSDGYAQVWDGESLGLKNTKIMSQKISNNLIQSLCWFHYAGQSHSFRFLALTLDGNVRLYSFWFDRKQQSYIGKCTQLSLLYNCHQQINESSMIRAHPFANFVFFSPGILLYMVDSHSLIYYPVVTKQPSTSFQQLTPNKKKQIYYCRDILFMKGLQIYRLKDSIQQKISLQNDLQYKQLKILRLDMRPWSNNFAPLVSKLMVVYYLKSSTRAITLSKVNLNQRNQSLNAYKQYNGNWILFIGPKQYYQPFILIVQEDRQTITVIAQSAAHPHDIQSSSQQQKKYFSLGPGQLYTHKLTIKVQKVYLTPFRYGYVVLYQSDNLLRFSSNINYDTELINYDVYTGLSLRMDYNDIILDIVWTYGGQIGAVVCLDKIVFINADLKIMKRVIISGYVVQGQWIGYTLLITTKKDVQYCDIFSKPQQAYCLQSLQSKYIIMRVMADRIIGAQKGIDGNINVKARYFKIMQPLISGYLNYQQIAQIPIDQEKIKNIIECCAPYFNVSQQFISLLNQKSLSSISKYFIQGNQKMYSKPLRAKTLNNLVKIQRFIPQQIWNRNKKTLLDLYLSYEESKDSSDPYQIEKSKQYAGKIRNIVGSIGFDSIKDISSNQVHKGITISNNFGEQSLFQIYHDYNKERQQVKMQIYPFKAQNFGQWLGQFGVYLQSKPYFDESQSTNDSNKMLTNMTQFSTHNNQSMNADQQQQDQQNEFKNLIVYHRCDDGKGQTIEDLSDYNNNGVIPEDSLWIPLEDQPMELEDKWGKKCPQQYSLQTVIEINKKLNTRVFSKITIQIWMKPLGQNFNIVTIGKQIQINGNRLNLQIKIDGMPIKLQYYNQSQLRMRLDTWNHLAVTFQPKKNTIVGYLNSQVCYLNKAAHFKLPKIPSSLHIGDPNKNLEFTEFRLWRRVMSEQTIKQNMRTPLEIVSQKRKRLRAKLKQKKKKSVTSGQNLNPFSLD